MRRRWVQAKAWLLYRLDRFVAWSPLTQLLALVGLTALLVVFWAAVGSITGVIEEDVFWWSLTRFVDGGTMAPDVGDHRRLFAVGITVSGIMVLSMVIGAIASKLGERVDELRRGQSPVVEREHLLILGFDPKVPLIARELARSGRRLCVVTLAETEKDQQDALLRGVQHLPSNRLRILTRTGDPRSELALLRVRADHAGVILVIPPQTLDDQAALRFTTSTLLALRRVTAPKCRARIVVEARRAIHGELLALVGEAGLDSAEALPLELVAADDIVARVLAQSVRHGAIHLALRELLSFAGSELYLEPLPRALAGLTFAQAHAQVQEGIALGVRHPEGTVALVPPDDLVLRADDQLVVLEAELGAFRLGGSLPAPPPVNTLHIEASTLPQTIAILGFNRTLGRLVEELDQVLPFGSTVKIGCPGLPGHEEEALAQASARCRRARIDRFVETPLQLGGADDPVLADAEGVILLGCEDQQDPDGDASAIALLLQLRQARRNGQRPEVRRLVTEVRDPILAQQIASSLDDFLVSTDVIGMMLAQAVFDAAIVPVHRELLDTHGSGLFVRPRLYYVPEGPSTFADVMSAARRRGDLAIGYCPGPAPERPLSLRERLELGQNELEDDLVVLDPPRSTQLPQTPDTQIIVIARADRS